MTAPTLETLRLATEDDVSRALDGAMFVNLTTEVELLEFFNRMLDVLRVPDADGDVME